MARTHGFALALASMAVCGSLFTGCGGCGADEPQTPEAQAEAAREARPDAFGDLETHLDLLRTVHLADIDQDGLFLDFGTPARMKYTVGHWKTGWLDDHADGAVTATRVGESGRVYFDLDAAGPITMRFRMKPIGTQVMTVYFNNEAMPAVRLGALGSDFADYDLAIPAANVRAGENYALLRFGGTTHIGNADVAVAMDSIRVVPGATIAAGEYAAPIYASLVHDANVDDSIRPALSLARGASATYHVLVPRGGKLGFGVALEGVADATAPVKVVLTAEGGAPTEIFSGEAGDEWSDEVVDLEAYAGKIVRIQLRSEGAGAGRIAWAAPSILVPPVEDERPAPAKNVVVLLIDTMRADKLRPFNPRSRVQTPTLDAFAHEGALFELAQSPENWTKPSVASVLTSLYPATHGTKTSEARLPSSALLLSEHLKANGFTTASFIANGYVSDRFGFDQGWDHYTNYIREEKSTLAANVFDEAGDWIEAHRGQRFFTYIQTIDPHVPYDPPAEYLAMYDTSEYTGQVQPRRTADQLEAAKRNPPGITFDAADTRRLAALYDGEVSYHDHELGVFIDRLKQLGVYDDTLFVVTADHGEEFNEHGSWGHGHSVYQELLHVPLMVRMNGVVPANLRIPEAVSTMDIAPTVVELAGIAPMPAAEGRSVLPYLRGGVPANAPSASFSDFLDDRRVIVVGHYKLILRGLNPTLFDLAADPGEQHELDRSRHPIVNRYCRVMLGQFLGATNRAQWMEPATAPPASGLQAEDAPMDDTMRSQLRALGYAN